MTPTEIIDQRLRAEFDYEVRQIETALEHHQRERQRLYRPDGTPRYSPAEHQEQLNRLLARFEVVAQQVTAEAEAARAKAEQSLAAMSGDPFDRLSQAEQERANLRRTFVQEDCDQQGYRTLTEQAGAARATGDRALIYLIARYGGRRLAAEASRGGGNRQPDRLGFIEAVRELEGRLADPRAGEKREALERKVEAAKSLEGFVKVQRQMADGSLSERIGRTSGQYRPW